MNALRRISVSIGLLLAGAAGAAEFETRLLTVDERHKESLAMDGAVAAWVSCDRTSATEIAPASCEVWAYDAESGNEPAPITNDAVEDRCVAIDGRLVAFRRATGAGEVVVRALGGGETILSSAGIDAVPEACPRLTDSLVVWLRGGRVVVRLRANGSERVVGNDVRSFDASEDFVTWQEGEGDAAEIWFFDAAAAAGNALRVTDNDIPDERPHLQAITNGSFSFPLVSWTRLDGGQFEISSWEGGAERQITKQSQAPQRDPQGTDYRPTLFGDETPLIAWSGAQVRYCLICLGDPGDVYELPADDPFLAGSPATLLEDSDSGWIVFRRLREGREDLGFFDVRTDELTPITDDEGALDRGAHLGVRTVAPFGPALVWESTADGVTQIHWAPEPSGGAPAALLALGALAARRAARRGDTSQ